MDITVDTNAERMRIRVEGAATIEQAAQLKEALRTAFEQGEAVELDLAQVSTWDLAAMQLLCAAHRFATVRGKAFNVAGWPAELAGLAKAYGFNRNKGCCSGQDLTCVWKKGGAQHG